MLENVVRELPSLGIAGLLFVMWWFERKERGRFAAGMQQALRHAGDLTGVNDRLLDVVRSNTRALAELREELRAHRNFEAEWLKRISRRLEQIEQRSAA